MSEKSSEDIKKVCLICGCHTKQAINIYEPRNGPNIIELIQAKFKFQPVNDDKYLCYSCNNWLINWHSLQTLNSSSSESGNGGQSSKSRLHINESIPEEECGEDSLKMRRGDQHNHSNISNQKRMGFYFSKRQCIKWRRIRKVRRKYNQFRSCTFCGRSLKTHLPIQFRGLSKKIILKCKTCRRILEWNRRLKQLNMTKFRKDGDELCFQTNIDLINRRCQRPLIDGKVVAMLRRLGTTLTRESSLEPLAPTQNQIQTEHLAGLRKMEQNEILIDFNTVITEVLHPFDLDTYQVTTNNTSVRKLRNTDVGFIEAENEKASLEAIYKRIPKCVTISIVGECDGAIVPSTIM